MARSCDRARSKAAQPTGQS